MNTTAIIIMILAFYGLCSLVAKFVRLVKKIIRFVLKRVGVNVIKLGKYRIYG